MQFIKTYWKPAVLCLSDGIIISAAISIIAAMQYREAAPVWKLMGAVALLGAIILAIGGYYAEKYRNKSMQLANDAALQQYNQQEANKNKALMQQLNLPDIESLQALAVADIEKENREWQQYVLAHSGEQFSTTQSSSLLSGIGIGLSFMVGAILPLWPYFFYTDLEKAICNSIITALIALPAAGFARCKANGEAALWGSLRVLLLGALAIGGAYLVATIF